MDAARRGLAAVLEPDEAVGRLVGILLIRAGYDIRVFEPGADLVSRVLQEGPFDLLITDASPGWTDGLDVLEAARGRWGNARTVVLCGLSDPDLAARVVQVADAVVAKPVVWDRLVSAVETHGFIGSRGPSPARPGQGR